jgi:hypothetical protein
MGNCLNAASKQQHPEARRRRGERVVPEEARSIGEMLLQEQEEERAPSAAARAGMKMKVVLKRAELEWLIAQLKSGDQLLEDVLRQVATAHTGADDSCSNPPRADGWRPRLERIIECPEPAAVDT